MTEKKIASELLCSYFVFARALSPEQQEQIFRLRYEVYCREFGYEREEDCPGQRETDPYDAAADHCLLRHRDSGIAAGCVRLVLPDDPGHSGVMQLPLEEACAASLNHHRFHPSLLPRNEICEVSRLAVLPTFRRRHGEEKTPFGDPEGLVFSSRERRAFPLLAVGLFLAATAMVGLAGRHHVFAIMEPRLARLLERSGLHFTQVGKVVEYHGRRAPFYIDQRLAEESMIDPLKELYREIRSELQQDRRGVTPLSGTA